MRPRLAPTVFCCIFLHAVAANCEDRAHRHAPTCVSSAHFVVRSHQGGPSATAILKEAAQLRRHLAKLWLSEADPASWNPRCEIVVHPTRTNYVYAVGRGGGQTSGSSLVQSDEGRIIQRRIDLVADARGELSSLAHELTHVVLADRFSGRQPPRWLDEGIALLSDSARKQSLHERDCRAALDRGAALRLRELLALERFAASHQVAPFYGQSHSLVRFLAERDDPAKLIAFAETGMDYGYDRALSQHYGIRNVADLERHWRAYASNAHATPELLIATGR